MNSFRPLTNLASIFILALIAFIALSQNEASEILSYSDEKYEKTADDAALNLHRWGAVTLFHGLPSDRVNAINEDVNGALWFGTDNGLVRYDGRRTAAIGSEGDNRGVLPSQRIRALFRDSGGGLWIGTDQGAARFVQETLLILEETRGRTVTGFAESPTHEIMLVTEQGQLIRYQNRQSDIKLEGQKIPLALTAQIIDSQTQPLLKIDDLPVAVKALVFYEKLGEWWLATHRRGGLVLRGDALHPTIIEAVPPPTRPYFVNAVFTEGGNLWLGAQAGANDSGLWLHRADASTALSKQPVITGTVNAIHGGNDDLWVGTEGQGAFLLRNGNVIEHLTFEGTKGGLRSNRIYSVFRDREGIVWFGTDRGVCRYDRDSFRTTTLSNDGQSNFVRSLLTTQNSVTYAGTNRGLFRLEAGFELGGWASVADIGNRAVHAMIEAKDGKVYVGTSAGLFVAPQGGTAFKLVPFENGNGSIRALAEYAGRVYAIVFERGIARIDDGTLNLFSTESDTKKATCLSVADNEKMMRIGTSEGQRFLFDGTNWQKELLTKAELSASPAQKAIRGIIATKQRLWIGKPSELSLVEDNQSTAFLSNVDVQSLTLATEGPDNHLVLYCATKNAGLYKILPESGAKIRFDTEQGLPSQQVFAVTKSKGGEVWIGTNRGIVRHQPNFTSPILEPRRMVADNIYTPDYLTKEMRFPAYQMNYLFEFAGLDSKTFPSQFQYEYTLEEDKRGLLRKIITSDSQFQLSGMKTGNYTITARAISRDLMYSAPFQFRLWISPEAVSWTTILLTTLLIVAIAAGGYAFYQQRRMAKANQNLEVTNTELRDTRIRLAHITEAERSRIARDLHDQTLADLRQLLVMTDQLDKSNASPATATPSLMRRKIEEVSSEIRHICEDLSPSVLENIGFVPALEWALTDAVTHLPAEEKFAYEFQCKPDLEERLHLTPTEQIQLYRIVQEAINNVCRHAQAKKVLVKVGIEDEHELEIEVIDDGIGIYNLPNNPTGHGIGNIRSRANLIGAEVKWFEVSQGSHFIVRKANAVNDGEAS